MIGCIWNRILVFKLFKERRMRFLDIGSGEMVEIGKFHPHLIYYANVDLLQVRLRDSTCVERPTVEGTYHVVDILVDNYPSSKRNGEIIGFNFWSPRHILLTQGCKKKSISLEHLVGHLSRAYSDFSKNVFGVHKGAILKVAKKHEFVWHVPQSQ
jgi:hypothetical protein